MKRAIVFALLAAATPARAQSSASHAPPSRPTRDVDILYAVLAGHELLPQRSRFAAAARLLRIDTPTPGTYFVLDEPNRRMDMVVSDRRSVMQMPYDPARVGGGLATGTPERLGPDTVAGLPCTEWQTTDNAQRPVVVCVTADGVTLRARSGANVMLQAVRVTYGPIDAAVFTVPADFQRQTPPDAR